MKIYKDNVLKPNEYKAMKNAKKLKKKKKKWQMI
jgi:hypothetical protein